MNNDVSICCILKNENKIHVLEWIDYYLNIGFDHIYLYNNGDPDSLNFLMNHENIKHFITIIPWHKKTYSQNTAYTHCIDTNKNSSWIAFFDIDEFIHIPDGDIKTFLSKYNEYGAVCLNWIIYTANNHILKQNTVLPNYTESILDHECNGKIKSIVQPKKTKNFTTNPHLPNFIDNFFGVDINFNKITSPINNNVYNTIYIKHFITKSFEDWLDKLDRGRANYVVEVRQKIDLFWDYNPNMINMKNDIYQKYFNRIETYINNKEYRFI